MLTQFPRRPSFTNKNPVRVKHLNNLDFIVLMRTVYKHYSDINQHLESWILESALCQTHDLLHQEQTPAKAQWIMQSLIDRLTESLTQQLEINELNDSVDRVLN